MLSAATAAAVVAGLLAAVTTPADAAVRPSTVASGPLAAATDPGDVWTEVSERPQARRGGLPQRVAPSHYSAHRLDLRALSARLDRAPAEKSKAAPLKVEVPAPNGDLVEFAVTESPVMEPGLAAQHPDITTYAGTTTGKAPASIRLDVTPMGFHASVRGPGASWYVDPAYNGAGQGADALYLSYDGADLPARDQQLIEPEKAGMAAAARRAAARVAGDPSIGEGGGEVAIQRTYRLALVTDPSYTKYFTTSTDPAVVNPIVTAEKVTLMNRVNQVYGDDLSVRMLLVDGNDALNFNTTASFLGANGPCGNVACYTTDDVGCGDVIDTNRYVVGQIIGADKYDIGHIMFGPDGDGGGVAYLGAVGTDIKAGGCTGLNPPTGDGFAIDYVAHEMGHQFAGNHTFNGVTGSCAGGNREATTSVEPGSGVTVMAYAGICGIDNLQSHSDPYFSQRSQSEIAAFTRSTPTNLQEIQNIALSGFTATGESFSISYGGTPSTVTVGTNYTAAGLKAALEAAEPSSATATVVGSKGTTFGTGVNGFQVTWSGTADIPTPTVTLVSGTFTSIVGTYDNGGPETMRGYDNPTPTGNHNPTVTAPPAKTIPVRTPFTLTGSGTDVDDDSLVYLWEQNNPGALTGTVLNSNSKVAGPLFRVFGTYANVTSAGTETYHSPGLNAAGAEPTRSFPDAAQVAAGETNAAAGTCPALTGTGTTDTASLRCFSEFLPTTARSLSFRLTARDLSGADGGTSFADTTLTVGTAGPFLATSQPTASSVAGNAAGTVTWNVASTNTATYATNVKISFSTDGGLTFPTVLAESTPNDGTEAIAWPNVATTKGRVKIEAVGNYFYDVTDGNITITPSAAGPTLTTGGNADGATFDATSSDALSTTPSITASSSSVDGSAITGTASGLPAGLSLTRGTSSAAGVRPGTTEFTVTGTADVAPGSYPVTVTIGDGAAASKTVTFTVAVTKDAATLTYTGDTVEATGTRTLSVTVADTDATPGTPTGTVAFTDQATGDALCTATIASGVASCTFAAPFTRIYRVVGTLTSPRYTGASSPATLLVTAVPVATLTTGGNAAGGTFTADSSDALSTTPYITAEASAVDGDDIAASGGELPAGLTLTRTTTSADGTRPGTTRFEVTGTADVDPGSYPVTVTVSDGAGNAADRTVSFTIVVDKDDATVTYTGDTAETVGTVTVSASVADTDSTPGTPAGTVAFTDQTTGDALCAATVSSGAASCTFEAPSPRTYQVVATLTSTRYTGASDAKALVVSAAAPTDTTPPQTSIASGPAQSSTQLGRDVAFTFASTEAGSTFRCTLNGNEVGCADGTLTRSLLSAGSYDLYVAATDAAGNTDATPVRRRFYVPVDDAQLRIVKGNWKRVSASGYHRNTYVSATQRTSTLRYPIVNATSLALVLSNAQSFGSVDVFLDDTKLVTINAKGTPRKLRVATIDTFTKPQSGTVRIVSRSDAQVRIDGLVVRTKAFTPMAAGRHLQPGAL
jgi:hypothetical protein